MKKNLLTAKKSRREGIALSDAAKHQRALTRRPFPPGVHGPDSRSRMTDYGKQLREKQKAKRMYGLNERQFSNLFAEMAKKTGDTGVQFIQALESRLDNVVYRSGLVKTRPAARQAVSHAQFLLNGKKHNVPSYRVRSGDVITIRDNKKTSALWKDAEEKLSKSDKLSWIAVDPKTLSVKVTGVPTDKELQQPFDIKMVVEFYSR